ncbi:hypothetical protein Pint_04724 [Pistacia integerrima]|uniref:Uncharacterized protein n=1 Tax=Pistacia integerrima TaxID=434235 RepID=A0ACC0Z7B9_9ROSI|nr:hypothetical protein Pint_04724 [Pistacia integerrima]
MKVKHLLDTLSTISHPLSSSEITLYLLASLPSSYDSLVIAITTRLDPISLDDLYGCLLTHENRLEQQTTSNEFNLPLASIATSYSGRGHRGSPSNRGAPHYGNRSRGRGRGFQNYSPHQMIHPRELSSSKDRVKMAFILHILSHLPPPVQLLTLAKEFRFHNGMHASDTLLYAQ